MNVNTPSLTNFEQILVCSAITVITLSIALTLSIGIVLPYHWTNESYFSRNSEKNKIELYGFCRCFEINFPTEFSCIHRTLSNHYTKQHIEASSASNEDLRDYPYLASLSIQSYHDDLQERKFACIGTILSNNWVLTGDDCVQEENEWNSLRIRVGSKHWSKGGQTHAVSAVSRFDEREGLVALKVHPPFNFDKNTRAVSFSGGTPKNEWTCAVSPGWKRGHSRKHEEFSVDKWSQSASNYGSNKGKIVKIGFNRSSLNGRALVTDNGLLLAMQLSNKNNQETIYVNLNNDKYYNWFQFLLGNSELRKVEFEELGGNFEVLSIYESSYCKILTDTTRMTYESSTQVIDNANFLNISNVLAMKENSQLPTTIETPLAVTEKFSSSLTETRKTQFETPIVSVSEKVTNKKLSRGFYITELNRRSVDEYITPTTTMSVAAETITTVETTETSRKSKAFTPTTVQITVVNEMRATEEIPNINTDMNPTMFPLLNFVHHVKSTDTADQEGLSSKSFNLSTESNETDNEEEVEQYNEDGINDVMRYDF